MIIENGLRFAFSAGIVSEGATTQVQRHQHRETHERTVLQISRHEALASDCKTVLLVSCREGWRWRALHVLPYSRRGFEIVHLPAGDGCVNQENQHPGR